VTTSWLRYSSLAAGTVVSRAEKASGSSHQGRSEFETLMQFLRLGDTLIVPHRPLGPKPARSPEHRAMLGVSAEFENDLRRERQMKGINAMKAYMLPPSTLPDDPDD
jgi:DNA invertase Pin-like site-specific DNA recombinase